MGTFVTSKMAPSLVKSDSLEETRLPLIEIHIGIKVHKKPCFHHQQWTLLPV